jgi:hypothetical protein
MDIVQLYQDYSVDFRTEGHKHCRPGWVNTECPWCLSPFGHEGYHLGYNLDDNVFVCWRCGWHPITSTVAKVISVSEIEAREIMKGYGLVVSKSPGEPIITIRKKPHRVPSDTGPLSAQHKKYLEKRNFDPDKLEKEWNLLSTGPTSMLDYLVYKHRIIIPFIWNEIQVSFDSRDTTGKDQSKYKACPKDRELIPHKDILYGKQEYFKGCGIAVEGPTDVWRLGPHSFATSGIKFTPAQVRCIAKLFQRVPVMFDGGEPQALKQANALVSALQFRGVDSFRVDITGDPGDMKQTDADYLVKQLIK